MKKQNTRNGNETEEGEGGGEEGGAGPQEGVVPNKPKLNNNARIRLGNVWGEVRLRLVPRYPVGL